MSKKRMAAANFADFWDIENTRKYSKLFLNEFLSDVTFIIGDEGTRVPGHSFILILCSWDFYNVFKLLKLDTYEIIIKDVPETSFRAFLKFCYTYSVDLGTADTSLDKTLDILKLSQRFHMKTLEQICLEYTSLKLSIMNCLGIFKHRELFRANSSVLNRVMNYIRNNFTEIMQVEENMDIFLHLSLEEVMYFEKRYIHISYGEKNWFDLLMKWAKRACEKEHIPPQGRYLKMVLGELFYKISFPDMTPTWFVEIIANYPGLLTTKEINKISRKINDNTDDCPGSDCIPQLTYDSDSRVVLFGQTIQYFTGPPKMDLGFIYEMISEFNFGEDIELRGFAFVVKRNEVVCVTSCRLRVFKIESPSNVSFTPDLTEWSRYRVNEEYDLIAIRFGQEYKLDHNLYWWACLICRFDKPVPIISSGQIKKLHTHGIWYKVNEIDAIPYLIFSDH